MGLKVIRRFGKTAKRKEFCRTAEYRRIYPTLNALAGVPSGFVPPKLNRSM